MKYSCNHANYPSGFFTASAFSSLRVVLHFLWYWDFHIQILGLASEDDVCWYDLDSNSLKIGFQQWTAWFKGSTFGSDEILSSWVALLASVPSYCCYMLFIDGCSPMDSAKLITTIPPPSQGKVSGGSDRLQTACSSWLRVSAWCLELTMVDCDTGFGLKLQCFCFPAIHLPLVKFCGICLSVIPFLTAR